MANQLSRSQGTASIAGTTIMTVPVDTRITLVGCRASNNSAGNRTVHIKVNGFLVSGLDTPLPVGSAIDLVAGTKIVALAGDTVVAFSDTDGQVDIHLSYLEQVA